MQCSAIVDQAKEFLRRNEQLTYGAIKRKFARDEEALANLEDEQEVRHA